MSRRIFALILSLCTLLALASCARHVKEPKEEDAIREPEPEPIGIVADCVHYYCSPTTPYEVFILERDGKFGVIDRAGNVLVEPTWDSAVLTHTAHTDVEWNDAEIKVYLSMDGAAHEGVFVNADGTTEKDFFGGWGGPTSTVYWDANNDTPLLFSLNDGYTEFRGTDVSRYQRPSRFSRYFCAAADTEETVIAVQAISSYELVEGVDNVHLEVKTEYENKYALLSLETGKLVSDFIYEDYDRVGEVNGILAVKQNGSWGYVDASGREITDFRYLPSFYEERWGENGYEDSPAFYPATGGLIAVNEGELYGFVAKADGKMLVTPQFAAVSMADEEGRFWAKNSDGTWSCYNANDFGKQ